MWIGVGCLVGRVRGTEGSGTGRRAAIADHFGFRSERTSSVQTLGGSDQEVQSGAEHAGAGGVEFRERWVSRAKFLEADVVVYVGFDWLVMFGGRFVGP